MPAKREKYTPNDVGPTPLDWGAPRLREVSSLITNGFVGTASPHYTDESGIPYLYGSNVRPNKVDPKGIRYITKDFHESQSKTELRSGDILTVQSGHIGESAVVPEYLEGANCHALIVTRLDKSKVVPEFLSYYLNSEIGAARLRGLEVGSTILHINTKDLKKFRIIVPPLEEQQKIAKILSAWDEAIATTEQLLANSEQQKKALMQQLLTGKKRLPGFEVEWRKVELGDILEYRQPTPYLVESTEYSDEYKTPVLTAGKTFILGYTDEDFGIFKEGLPVIIFDDFTTSSRFVDFEFKVKSSAIKILSARAGHSIKYVFEAMQMIRYAVGGHQRHWISIFANLVVPMPPLEEQEAIASALSSADDEIKTLRAYADRLKAEKKALIQQLLTGKRRVQVDGAERSST